jgi:transglutaminase-like putative cysteine protease
MHLSDIDASLVYEVSGPSHLFFNLEAAHFPGQRIVSEKLTVTVGEGAGEPVELRRFHDPLSGNRFVRFDVSQGPLQVRYQAQVERILTKRPRRLPEMPVTEIPDELMPFLMPTRYCPSDVMARDAQALFGKVKPGLARVEAVVDWIHKNIVYQPGSTDSTSTAQDAFVQRAGVCRDFAHLGVTFCRALNIPARLVVGYVYFDEPPQDFHAVFEAWLGGRWVLFDPTRMAPIDNLVRVGTGRDAKDVAFCTIFGPVRMLSKDLQVHEHEAPLALSALLRLKPRRRAPARTVALVA